jgi:periplasmic divalent cation tolerance protein
VQTAIDDEDKADELAAAIVERKLAACVQRLPIQSVYRWKGEIESSGEFLLMAKTRAALAGRLTDFVRERHPYELPEIVVTPITGGLKAYLEWVAEETREQPESP